MSVPRCRDCDSPLDGPLFELFLHEPRCLSTALAQAELRLQAQEAERARLQALNAALTDRLGIIKARLYKVPALDWRQR